MARLTEKEREQVLADYNVGKSQNELARKYRCSPATINKLCKGVIPKYKEKVNAVATIKGELQSESEYQSECFNEEVNNKLKNITLIHKLTKLNLKDISEKLGDGLSSISDNKFAQEAIDKASITLNVNQRHATTNITNTNTQVSVDVNQDLTDEQIRKEISKRGLPLQLMTSIS